MTHRCAHEWDINQTLPLLMLMDGQMYVYGDDGRGDSRHFLVSDFCDELAERHARFASVLREWPEEEAATERTARIDSALGIGNPFRPDAVTIDREGAVSIVEAKVGPLSSKKAREAVAQAIEYAKRLTATDPLAFLDLIHHIHWWSSGLRYRHRGYRGFLGQHEWHFGRRATKAVARRASERPAIRLILIVQDPGDRSTQRSVASLQGAVAQHPDWTFRLDLLDARRLGTALRPVTQASSPHRGQ